MIIKTSVVPIIYKRNQNGKIIEYTRVRTIYVLSCDNCDHQFTRTSKEMNSKRARTGYVHVCNSCDQKKFAQEMSVLRKRRKNYDASSTIPLNSVH